MSRAARGVRVGRPDTAVVVRGAPFEATIQEVELHFTGASSYDACTPK